MSCTGSTYCLSNTGNSSINDNYYSAGTHNGNLYYTGDTNNLFIYYSSSNDEWCLSTALDGSCIMSGDSPGAPDCPDLSDFYFSSGMCPTPTPTPTPAVDCSSLDFDAIFDCDVTPTPSVSPTSTPTPTPTITPTSSDICGGTGIVATIESITPTPTPTPTITPTSSSPIVRPCVFSGDVMFNVIEGDIVCPYSYEFQDCYNGAVYLTTSQVSNPSGGDLEEFDIFNAEVNGESRCISFIKINLTEIGGDIISLTSGPLGKSNEGDCIYCQPSVSMTPTPTPTPTQTQTPTPTPTPTMTPESSPTPTPTMTPQPNYYVYRNCSNSNNWLVQSIMGDTVTPGDVQRDDSGVCWEFQYISLGYPNLNPSLNVTNYTGNYFNNQTVYPDCDSCLPLVSCIESLTFVVEYNNSSTVTNGNPCTGGHHCSRAVFDITANGVPLGQVNLNNQNNSYDNLNYPPNYPNYTGANSRDRYNAIPVTSQQAQDIASNSPDGLIDFSFDCACVQNVNCSANNCHNGIGWVRLIKDLDLPTEETLYSGCPTGSLLSGFDPCQTTLP